MKFSEPYREEAATLVAGLQAHLRRAFEAEGWRVDSTHDLARMLRIPRISNACRVCNR